jgi:hypothetical protein
MKPNPTETEMVGDWEFNGTTMHANAVCERIEWLVKNHLRRIKDHAVSGAWETLFLDPDDGRFWERDYPRSEMHGGGPAALRCISHAEAQSKYGVA